MAPASAAASASPAASMWRWRRRMRCSRISEVRHGIAPTPISTHMVNAIGLRQTRRYALTGERFGADEAARIGLVHEVVAADRMEARLAEVLDAIILGAPGAIARDQAVVSRRQRTAAGRARGRSCWRMRAGCSASRRRARKAPRRSARSASRRGTACDVGRNSAAYSAAVVAGWRRFRPPQCAVPTIDSATPHRIIRT